MKNKFRIEKIALFFIFEVQKMVLHSLDLNPSEDKASISTSGSKSALKSSIGSKKAAKKSSKAKKSDEVSIKMPATIPTPKTRKPPSRFSLRGTYTHVHIFVRFGF